MLLGYEFHTVLKYKTITNFVLFMQIMLIVLTLSIQYFLTIDFVSSKINFYQTKSNICLLLNI